MTTERRNQLILALGAALAVFGITLWTLDALMRGAVWGIGA